MLRCAGVVGWLAAAVCLSLLRSSSSASAGPRYQVAYACEGSNLSFSCEQGEVINLVRANFGRFSITICNEHGNTDWSVNCMSHRSIRVLHDKCADRQSCSVPASVSEFGDPCPTTHKYLEAHYMCSPATVLPTTKKAPPAWLTTTTPPPPPSILTETPFKPPPPPFTTTTTTTSTTTTTTASTTSTATTSTTTTATTTTTTTAAPSRSAAAQDNEEDAIENSLPGVVNVPVPGPARNDILESHQYLNVGGGGEDIVNVRTEHREDTETRERSRNRNLPPLQPRYYSTPSPPRWEAPPAGSPPVEDPEAARAAEYCPPVTLRGVSWNWTRIGDAEVLPCPNGARGAAHWRCHLTEAGPRRQPQHPDLSQCRSLWLTNMETQLKEHPDVLRISNELADVTDATPLYGGDLDAAVRLINKLPVQLDGGEQHTPDPHRREAVVAELTKTIVRTTSNLLSERQRPMWTDLGESEGPPVMTSLMLGVEENAFLLGSSLAEEKSVVQYSDNMLLSVRLLSTWEQGAVEFPSAEERQQLTQVKDYVRIPGESLRANTDGGRAVVVFMTYENMDEILRPPPAAEASEPQPIVNSRVISASLGKGRHVELPYPALLILEHLHTHNVTNPRCVFWDYQLNGWSPLGCRVLTTNQTHTHCECDHLTNFAVLMDVHATPIPEADKAALQIITWIGCGVSIVCLILAIITFQFFRRLKSDRNSIHKNLCICLLIGEVVFLAGIGQTQLRVVCGVVAGLLHYFFLCAFAWMFFEGFQLYVMVIEVFEAEKSRIRWYYVAAYGLPALIVAVSCIVDPTNYGTADYCWLRTDNYFILAFVGPVVLVILANLVFLGIAVSKMCRHSVATVTMKSKEQSRLSSVSDEEESVLAMKMKAHLAWIRGAVALVFLLGLTWALGLLYINQKSIEAAYAFTIFNSLQGLFIFFFHCVQNEKTRSEYRRFFSQAGWLPACVRPSSKAKDQTSSYFSNTQTTHAAGSPTTYLANVWSPPDEDPTKHRHQQNSEARRVHGSLRSPTHRNLTRDKKSSSLRSAGRDSGNGGSAPDSPPRLNNYPLHELPPGSLVQNSDFFVAYSQQRWRPPGAGGSHQYVEVGEPVYEEIDREPTGGAGSGDLSDEEARRQNSDISRQSSRSYGDSRPLIAYYPERPLLEQPEQQRRLAAQMAPPAAAVPCGVDVLAAAGQRRPVSALCESNLRDFNQRQVMDDLQQLHRLQALQAAGRHLAAAVSQPPVIVTSQPVAEAAASRLVPSGPGMAQRTTAGGRTGTHHV